MSNNPPVDVQKFGQSIWYDNISRDLLENGEIQRLVDEDGVVGITSNPTIFEKAIAHSSLYDETIDDMLDSDANAIYEKLAIADIQAGARILQPIFEQTNGVDGYISLEVSPLIANDTETTISEARRLFKAVGHPNVMIKIPGTDAGIPAIETTISEGINVNVTLLFSIEQYEKVMEAYLNGLEKRIEAGESIADIASVASFFVSRVDSMIDQQLESNLLAARGRDLDRVAANRKLLGKAGIANARLAYQRFKAIFSSERFRRLKDQGARVQRPLWASTGVKNPAYSPTLYLDSLIGADTVNTVPPHTLRLFKEQGTVDATLERDVTEAREVMDMLESVGISMDMVTQALQADGVDKFAASFSSLMKTIEGKRQMLAAGIIQRQHGVMGAYERRIRENMEQMTDAPAKIWDHRASWWKEDRQVRDKIRNRLGWLTLPDERIDKSRLENLQQTAKKADWQHVVLLGMGGSSMAPKVMRSTFGIQPDFPELIVLDSTVPAAVKAVEEQIDLAHTLFLVSSKSGSTIETLSFFAYFYNQVQSAVGEEKAGQHFIAITDPGTPLVKLAQQNGFLDIFENPADIGGRYSALSYFGLVPAALMGLEIERIYASVDQMQQAIDKNVPSTGNPALWLGVIIGTMVRNGLNKMSLLTSPALDSFGLWVEQLVAESTGKEGKGVIPVVGSTFGLPHDYDDDRLFIYMRLDGESSELDQRVQLLWEAGHPVYRLELPDTYALAGEFLRWEFATAVIGQMLGVNPFDEPDVQLAKDKTAELLKYYENRGSLPDDKFLLEEGSVSLYVGSRVGEMLNKVCEQRNYDSSQLASLLAAHIGQARSGNYIALLAYIEASTHHSTLMHIQRRLRHTTQRAVTLGYGPRYLHSTGQLHKGGPEIGLYIMITVDDEVEQPIPGKPYTFSILKQAQALGDLQALRERRQRVVRLHISGAVDKGLDKILEAIEATRAKQK